LLGQSRVNETGNWRSSYLGDPFAVGLQTRDLPAGIAGGAKEERVTRWERSLSSLPIATPSLLSGASCL